MKKIVLLLVLGILGCNIHKKRHVPIYRSDCNLAIADSITDALFYAQLKKFTNPTSLSYYLRSDDSTIDSCFYIIAYSLKNLNVGFGCQYWISKKGCIMTKLEYYQ